MISDIKKYWELATPMTFDIEKWSFSQKRAFRYNLQDYMIKDKFFEGVKGKRVLEVGCGSGIDACEFASNGANITAIDITKNAIDNTKELAHQAIVKVNAKQYDGVSIPYANDSFDLVYSYGVLHHIPDVETTLTEIHRVLKATGQILVMIYNRNSLLFAHSILHHSLNSNPWMQVDEKGLIALASRYSERIENCPYTKCYTKEEASKLFSKWFGNIKIDTRYNVIDTVLERKVKIQCPEELGWHLIIRGSKK